MAPPTRPTVETTAVSCAAHAGSSQTSRRRLERRHRPQCADLELGRHSRGTSGARDERRSGRRGSSGLAPRRLHPRHPFEGPEIAGAALRARRPRALCTRQQHVGRGDDDLQHHHAEEAATCVRHAERAVPGPGGAVRATAPRARDIKPVADHNTSLEPVARPFLRVRAVDSLGCGALLSPTGVLVFARSRSNFEWAGHCPRDTATARTPAGRRPGRRPGAGPTPRRPYWDSPRTSSSARRARRGS
ncbi:MAG: hypothetical protein JWQ20_1914 [Conexibacter sp.]|nr:hypothetical protein [Conexibacter sp.]